MGKKYSLEHARERSSNIYKKGSSRIVLSFGELSNHSNVQVGKRSFATIEATSILRVHDQGAGNREELGTNDLHDTFTIIIG